MKKTYLTIFAVLFAALVFNATATCMFQVDLEELSNQAEMIVQAEVTDVVTRWNADSSQIFTYIRMNIDEELVGEDEDNEIIIKQVGGKIGSKEMVVLGVTSFAVGEEDILFLFTDPQNRSTHQTVGMYQGKYRIYTDQYNVKRVTQDEVGKACLHRRAGDTGTPETGNDLPLDEFKNRIMQIRQLNGK